MKRIGYKVLGTLVACSPCFAKNENIEFYGSAQGYVFCDTRQVIGSRGDYVAYLPAPEILDPLGVDCNAVGNLGFGMSQSYMGVNIKSRKICGMDVDGKIQGDFWGSSFQTTDVWSILRLQLAYINMSWNKIQFLFGQSYHPLFSESCYPHVISFNTGQPFDIQTYSPQLRFGYYGDNTNAIFAFDWEHNYASLGPVEIEGTGEYLTLSSPVFMQRTKTPDVTVRVERHKDKWVLGAAFNVKGIMPEIKTINGYSTRNQMIGWIGELYGAYEGDLVSARTKIFRIDNGYPQGIVGGYAVSHYDDVTHERTYEPITLYGGWFDSDVHINKCLDLGIYIAFLYNHKKKCTLEYDPKDGTEILAYVAPRRLAIAEAFRFSPRILYRMDALQCALEIEGTGATYGTYNNHLDVVDRFNPVFNVRTIFWMSYSF